MVTSSSLSFLLLSTLLAPTIVLLLQSSILHANPGAYFHTCLSNKRWKNPSAPVSVTGALYTRDNSSFSDILSLHTRNKRFNRPYTPKPIAIITPFHESHIQAAVVCSKASNFQLRIRNGSHDYEGYSYVSDVLFVLLDMYTFKSIHVNPRRKKRSVSMPLEEPNPPLDLGRRRQRT